MPIPITTTVYRTADGKEFKDELDAVRHEVTADLVARFDEAASHRKMYVNTFLSFILQHREAVLKYLEAHKAD